MNTFVLLQSRLRWINLPGLLVMALLQRLPALNPAALGAELTGASPLAAVIRSAAVMAAALGAVNTMVGATPLVPSSGTATAFAATVGNPVSVFYTVNGTQTPPKSWTLTGSVPPGLNFSGLTGPGSVNVGSLDLSGTPTAAGIYNLTLQTFQFVNEVGVGSPVYSYTVTVTGSGGNSAPAFTTQPGSQSVTVGSAVTFTVAASGTPAPTFQWKMGGVDISGATGATLNIASAGTGDAGSYTAVATNTAGSATSNAATLTVNAATAAPAFTTQPTNQSVTVGSAATFIVAATGTPAPTFQWRKGGVDISGATGATFNIASTGTGDAGSYTAVATNTAGSVTSNSATLTVNAATAAPAFTTQPSNQTVTAGSAVSFTVAVSGTPTPTLQWMKDTVAINAATAATFTIASAAAGDAGSYTVVATNSAGSVASSPATLAVTTAATAASITTQPASQTVTVGSSVTFTVAASGSPTPTYQWRKNGAAIGGATNATFTIASVAASDAGSYTAVATNTVGSATSSAATLTTPVSRLVNATVATGHAVVFSAGSTSGSIQWQASGDGGATWTNLANGGAYSGATTSSLAITNADSSLHGLKYRFVATDGGTVSTSPAVMLAVAPAYLPFPTSIAVDSAGNLYVGDANSDTIQMVSVAGLVTLVAGTNGTVGSADGTGAAARFNQPNGLTLLTSGTLIVSDTSNATIRSIASGGAVTTLAGSPATRGHVDGAGNMATFSSPIGVSRDAANVVYIADAMNDTIRKIAVDGTVSTLAGSAGVTGFTDGTGAAARFNFPSGLVVDGGGTIYVADTTNNLLRKVTSGGVVTTLAGVQNVAGFDDGTGGGALFHQPEGLAVDGAGNLYLADTGNSTIRKITPAGVVTTIAGLPTISGLEDGPGTFALFNHPQALCMDTSGTLFVADTGNAAIRKIDTSGNVTTVALTSGGAPAITTQPTSQTVSAGAAVMFTAAASGSPAPTYQWQKGGAAIAGATGTSYSIASASIGDAGSYTVIASNPSGTATSSAAMLNVNIPQGPPPMSGGGGGGSPTFWLLAVLPLLAVGQHRLRGHRERRRHVETI